MKINTNCDAAVISSNINTDSTKFKILATPQAFKILTDNLYTNKISTIIRELSCNAWDSQILKGNSDKPFDIFVPDRTTDPIFYIRDYGVGLSDQAMKDLYTSYFGTDKTHTNELIGGLGLGSKTPLCYTEQFTVTSYFDGLKTDYLVSFSSDGTPQLTLINKQKTNEPTGLKVQIGIKEEDIYDFQQAIKDFFAFNGIKPRFLNQNIELPKLEVKFKYKNLTIYKSVNNVIKVKLGMVNYNLNRDDISINDLEERCQKFQEDNKQKYPWLNTYDFRRYVMSFFTDYYKRNGIMVIEFPIGSLSVTASREALSLDERSRETLQKSLFELASEIYIKQHLEKQKVIQKATLKSYVEFMKNYNSDICQTDINALEFKDKSVEIVNNWCRLTDVTQLKLLEKGFLYSICCNSNKKYRSVGKIYAENVSRNGYLFKLYVGSNTMNQIIDYATDNFDEFPNSFYYLKVKPKELEKVKQWTKTLNKFMFCVEPISIEVEKKDKKASVPLFETICCPGIKYVINENYKQFYYKKAEFESYYPNKNETIYYMNDRPNVYFSELKENLRIFRYKYPNIDRFFILKPRQISTLKKVGYNLVDLRLILDPKFVSKMLFRYKLRTNFRYSICNLGDSFLGCFSDNVKQKLDKLQKVFDSFPDTFIDFDYDKNLFRLLWNDTAEERWRRRISKWIDRICLEDVKERREEIIKDIFNYFFYYELGENNECPLSFKSDYTYILRNKNALLKNTCKYIREQVRDSVSINIDINQ